MTGKPTQLAAERPAIGALLQFSWLSLGSESLEGLGQYAKSLRPLPRIFPFSGDGCRRLSSIITAWRVPESYRSGGVRQEEIVSPHSIRPRKGDVP
jgi:hypothetical protein